MRHPEDLPTVLSSANSEFLEDLYEQFLNTPERLDPEWKAFFEEISSGNGSRAAAAQPRPMDILPESAAGLGEVYGDRGKQSAVFQLINNYRVFGHTRAKLDPLGRPHMQRPPDLSLHYFGLTEEDLDETFSTGTLAAPPSAALRDIVAQVEATYCGSVGVEYMMIRDQAQRRWLQQTMEQTWNQPRFDKPTKLATLTKLTGAELFEKYLHTKFVGQKRFSLEGAETLINMLDGLAEEASDWGVEEVVLGMPHRGRLNVLVNILEKAPEFIFSEFEDKPELSEVDGSGDVKYHLGYSSDRVMHNGREMHLSLVFNPSHLEAVDPVVEGSARAKQDRRGDASRTAVMPVLIHGDAAFSGQGLVAETLNLSQLQGYRTGGTVHIIVNNQIGFTTPPRHLRSHLYPSDIAKVLNVPVLHVNGDDPEAVMHAIKLAVAFRQQFHTDIVIDLFCYRRHGHNEMDEPNFTQPLTYSLIDAHPSTLEIYAKRLQGEGTFSAAEIERVQVDYKQSLDDALERMRRERIQSVTETLKGAWSGLERQDPRRIVVTEVTRDFLEEIADALTSYPEDFTPHRRVKRLLQQRADMVRDKVPMDWGMAELLAYGSLVKEGFTVRFSGQDSSRGTFSHRHANLVDVTNGRDYVALQHVPGARGRFEIWDSPLSEAGVVGFEFGYSLADPLCLTLWEAQFGDFVNGAQVIIDQFVTSSEEKWLRMSGLVMLLPHGYEGQGPEHSSARLERFLQMCADDNIRVVNATTPAQNFHLQRRQLHSNTRKPLIQMSPKSLLRHPLATSSVADLIDGHFREVLFEKDDLPADKVRRVIFCSGKVYYDLLAERRKREQEDVALIRLEQLYPFRRDQVEQVLHRYANAGQVWWVQEEPKNMGAWFFVQPCFQELLPSTMGLRYVGRRPAASPAVGSHQAHTEEQKALVDEALT